MLRRARERAHFSDAEPLSSHFASRRWFLPSQHQTSIYCLEPKGRHRRLSVCSLPVLKQSAGSLGSFISVAQSVSRGTWQSARCVILVLFLSLALFFRPRRICHLLQVRNPVRFPIAHELLRSFPTPEIKALPDLPSVKDSLGPNGTLTVLVLASREFAIREMPTKNR